MEHLAPGIREAVQLVGIGFERMGFALHIDHGFADEGREQIDDVTADKCLHSVEMTAVQRRLIEIEQRSFVNIAIGNDGHDPETIVGDPQRFAATVDFDGLAQKAAEAFRRYIICLRGGGLIAGFAIQFERGLEPLAADLGGGLDR
ncbi:hypothetical protein F9288_02850 [Sphingomonas sp. CL5.1]|nr:hypothetical protein F9288_02850 [Sphingomonas sp. CL5.1]